MCSGDDITILFQREVPGVEQVEVDILQVPLIGISALGGEDRIVFTPYDEGRRLIFPEVSLPAGILRRISAVAMEQLQLDSIVPGAVHEKRVHVPAVGTDRLRVPHAIDVLPFGGFRRQELPQGGLVFGRALLPEGFERFPEFPQSFVVGVAVLDDERLHLFRMTVSNAKTDGSPVVEQVQAIFLQAFCLDEFIHYIGQVFETVFVFVNRMASNYCQSPGSRERPGGTDRPARGSGS